MPTLRRAHWLLLLLGVLFLFSYFGLLSWGRIEESLESLAAKPSGAKVFHANVDRADAIFIVFMFLMLTPIALAAVAGLIAFVGAVLAGFLESLVRVSWVPDWVVTGFVYCALIGAGYLSRAIWAPQAQGFFSLLARSVVAAYQ